MPRLNVSGSLPLFLQCRTAKGSSDGHGGPAQRPGWSQTDGHRAWVVGIARAAQLPLLPSSLVPRASTTTLPASPVMLAQWEVAVAPKDGWNTNWYGGLLAGVIVLSLVVSGALLLALVSRWGGERAGGQVGRSSGMPVIAEAGTLTARMCGN